jgi:hypothetical protein
MTSCQKGVSTYLHNQRYNSGMYVKPEGRNSDAGRNFYQTTRRYNPEDSNLRTHRRENLKSYGVNFARIMSDRSKTLHLIL